MFLFLELYLSSKALALTLRKVMKLERSRYSWASVRRGCSQACSHLALLIKSCFNHSILQKIYSVSLFFAPYWVRVAWLRGHGVSQMQDTNVFLQSVSFITFFYFTRESSVVSTHWGTGEETQWQSQWCDIVSPTPRCWYYFDILCS